MRSPTKLQQDVIDFPYMARTTLKVEAGPGSGKSYTLLCKVFWLLSSNQMQPEEIIIVSLTNKAVDNIIGNMLKVFHELNQGRYTDSELDSLVSQVGVYTLHGLSNVIVTENVGVIDIIEENGWRGILKLIPEEFLTQRGVNTSNARTAVKQLEKMINNDQDKEYTDGILQKIKSLMKISNVLTNSDLIRMAVKVLKQPSTDHHTPFTNSLLKVSRVLMVDEFQDLYPEICPLLEILAMNKQLIMFGDTNQSIYEFLGSNHEVLKRIEAIRDSNSNFVKTLADNFRCTPELISAANCIANHNLPSNVKLQAMVSKNPSQVHPCIKNFDEVLDELDYLMDEICQLVCATAKFSDIAILTRTNAHSKVIADHLATYGLPVKKLTAQPDWISDPKIRFIIDVMQAANKVSEESELPNGIMSDLNRKSDFSIIITLASMKGLGSVAIQQLHQTAMDSKLSIWKYLIETPRSKWPLTSTNRAKVSLYVTAMSELIEKICYKKELASSKLLSLTTEMLAKIELPLFTFANLKEATEFKENLHEFYTAMKLSEISKPPEQNMLEWFLETFLDQSIIFHNHGVNSEEQKELKGKVNISTIHSSKGLEFPIVFLMGRNGNGTYPIETKPLYVGMTRARNKLYLVNVKHPKISSLQVSCESVMRNEKFWEYYNNDLKRPVLPPRHTGEYTYRNLQKQFGIGKRNFHTISKYFKTISRYII